MKKTVLSLIALFATFSLAGCGGETSSSPEESSTSQPGNSSENVSLAYQFLGSYHEVAAQFAAFDFLANLQSDGTGTLYRLTSYSDESRNTLEESDVSWSVEEDRDGLKTMSFTEKDTGTIQAIETDGSYTLSLRFTFAGSYSRTIDFVGSSDIQYETVDSWRQAVEGKAYEGGSGTDPDTGEDEEKEVSYRFFTEEVIIDATETVISNCAAECVLYEDGSAKARNGYAMGGTIYSDYVTEEGTWVLDSDKLTIVLAEKEFTAEKNEDGLFAFTWTTENDEGPVHASFVEVA